MNLRFFMFAIFLKIASLPFRIRSRCNQIIFRLGDAGKYLLRLIHLVIEPQLFDTILDCTHRVTRIIYSKVRGKADGVGEFPQEPDEDRMEGAHPDAAGLPLPHHPCDALLHLGGGLLGKSKGQNPRRIRPLFDHIGDSGSQYAGFSGACPRHDQHRSFHTFNRLPLLLVQIL